MLLAGNNACFYIKDSWKVALEVIVCEKKIIV